MMVQIGGDQADYVANLVRDRIEVIEARMRVSVTPQEDAELASELALAEALLMALRGGV